MTIAAQVSADNRTSATGNGVTTSFPFQKPFTAQADLVVLLVLVASPYTATTQVLNTDYTISGVADAQGRYGSGGNVVFGSAPSSLYSVVIYADPVVSQGLDLVENDPLPAEQVELGFDKLTLIVRRLKDVDARTLRQPDADTTSIGVLPATGARASQYLAFDALGNPTAASVPSAGTGTFLQSGTGAAAITWTSAFSVIVTPEQFGAVGDGTTNDTTAVQAAVNRASGSIGPGLVLFNSAKTYLVATITPKENVTLAVGGATLKLKNATEEPMFSDTAGHATYSRNFTIIGGTYDCNKANNFSTNHSGGFLWLTNWRNIRVVGPKIKNAFKDVFLFAGCEGIDLEINEPIEDCGTNAGGFYSYGAVFTPDGSSNPCRNIKVRGFPVLNHFGFGMHFNKAEGFSAENLNFDTVTKGGVAIAITCTQATRGHIRNVRCKSVDGQNIEMNANTDVVIENLLIDSAGDEPIVWGDNLTGISNERCVIRNVKTVSTGASGAVSVRMNYAKNCVIENFDFDKGLDTSNTPDTDTDNVLRNGVFAVATSVYAMYYGKFNMENVRFTNFEVIEWKPNRALITNVRTSAAARSLSVANPGVTYVELDDLIGNTSSLTVVGFITGKLTVTSWFNNVQRTREEFSFTMANDGANFNICSSERQDGATSRAMTVVADAANYRFSITNSTGDTCLVSWVLEINATRT